jgi:hypothetical protein
LNSDRTVPSGVVHGGRIQGVLETIDQKGFNSG